MKELIPMDDMGVLVSKAKEEVLVDSRMIAEVFEKEHFHVMRDIDALVKVDIGESKSGCTEEEPYSVSGLSLDFIKANFFKSAYTDVQNKKRPCYLLTRDGFTVLAMGYTGKKAMAFKEAYIRRFNEMEGKLLQIQTLRDQHPFLTDAIRDAHEEAKPFHFSNEADMLNRIVVGMTAKAYREEHGIPKSEPIRPHFTTEEAALMEYLQYLDTGFLYSISDFQQRKQKLEWCAVNWKRKHVTSIEAPGDRGLF